MLLKLYHKTAVKALPVWNKLLEYRLSKQKEFPERINERRGITTLPRPTNANPLIWLHAASVGETQSSLILIEAITKQQPNVQFLVTSGTVTSANLMAQRLPENAFHQFAPYDQPEWVNAFLDYWRPDFVLWMESELWPNMLGAIKERKIPAALINARLSKKSFMLWRLFKNTASEILSSFDIILTQTSENEKQFKNLGQLNVITTDNIKYSAAPLPVDSTKLSALKEVIQSRPLWVYASTHEGEEALACKLHATLKQKIPDLLTVIIPRHPERANDVKSICDIMKLFSTFLPRQQDDIYIVNTMGELGLFYNLSPIALIGRSFSDDGGGGHNPIEAAQQNCVVLTGPNFQYQQELFDDMFAHNAAFQMDDKTELLKTLQNLFADEDLIKQASETSYEYAQIKNKVIDVVMENLTPHLDKIKIDHAA